MTHPSSALTGRAAANMARATATLTSRRRPDAAVIARDLTYSSRPVTNIRHDIRNVAIIAHVDHGKTTLVDALLKQSHTFRENQQVGTLIMDTNDLEREKGITILAKNTSVRHEGVTINIIDTPGHADFGGEVERVLNMAGGCLMLVANRAYDDYTGTISIGRITRGSVAPGHSVAVLNSTGGARRAKVVQVLVYRGLDRIAVPSASAGDIVLLTGLDEVAIGDTLADPESPDALPRIEIEEPTVRMTFGVNTSPFTGREGKFSTTRQLRARLYKELDTNLGLHVADTEVAERFLLSGRGELHLAVLIETMRLEGYEFEVSRPEAIVKLINGQRMEPVEHLTVDVREEHVGGVTEALGKRRAEMIEITYDKKGGVRLEYLIPTRGLIGFRNTVLTLTAGTGLMG